MKNYDTAKITVDLINSVKHVTERTVCSFVTNLIKFLGTVNSLTVFYETSLDAVTVLNSVNNTLLCSHFLLNIRPVYKN